MPAIAAIDQGTTSTRCILFDFSRDNPVLASAQQEHRQIFPQPGWVEHDPLEILTAACDVLRRAIAAAADAHRLAPADIAAIGITNQRETVVAWDTRTGKPFHNALVWQDTRTADFVAKLADAGGPDRFRAATGLPLATYFSASKIRWLLDNVPAFRAAADAGHAACGTIDTWLTWNLAGRTPDALITDVTNASRTQLLNLHTLDWDDSLLRAFNIPRHILPRMVSSTPKDFPRSSPPPQGARAPVRAFAHTTPLITVTPIPISALLGDQQAALVGQTCLAPGDCKCTYGTGSFLLMNTGESRVASTHGLLTTVAYQFADAPAHYALEGSIAVTGSLIQWLRDNLGVIASAADVEPLAASVPDSGGVVIVPAFSGLFAPYWRPEARGLISGLTRFSTKAHLARAALDAVACQTRDVLDAMTKDAGHPCPALKVDGGMTANNLLLQLQADILDVPVLRPAITETTALGTAYAAALAVGEFQTPDALRSHWRLDRTFAPATSPAQRAALYAAWKKAIARTLA